MNSTASAALTSAENTAARPSAPTTGGKPRIRIVGSARSGIASAETVAGPRCRAPRHAGVEQQAERIETDADPHRAIVARAEDFLQQSRRHDERGRQQREIHDARRPGLQNVQYVGSPRCTADSAWIPPMRSSTSGHRDREAAELHVSCTMFTHADVSRPPAVKYAVITAPPITHPAHDGIAATISRITPIANS